MTEQPEAHPIVEVALWAALLALLLSGVFVALQPEPDFPFLGVLLHTLGSATLTALLLLAAVWRPGRGDGIYPKGEFWAAGAVLGMGILVELLQALWSQATSLEASPVDVVLDAIGVAAGWLLWRGLRHLTQRTENRSSDTLSS